MVAERKPAAADLRTGLVQNIFQRGFTVDCQNVGDKPARGVENWHREPWQHQRRPQAVRRALLLSRCHIALPSRSEEHTSELQSLMRISYAVFCLKKKKKDHHTIDRKQQI